jgi:hypothetical protein
VIDPLNDLLAAATFKANLAQADALWAYNEIVRLRAALATALADLLKRGVESFGLPAMQEQTSEYGKPAWQT